MNTHHRPTASKVRPLLWAAAILLALMASACGGNKPAPGYQEACSSSAIFTIVLDNFTDQQASALSSDLESMRCFGSLAVKSGAVNTSTHHEYIYSSGLGASELERGLKQSLDKAGLKASVSSGDHAITLTGTPEPKQR